MLDEVVGFSDEILELRFEVLLRYQRKLLSPLWSWLVGYQ